MYRSRTHIRILIQMYSRCQGESEQFQIAQTNANIYANVNMYDKVYP